MNSFWGGFSENFSQRGRTAALFIFIILLMGAATIYSLTDYHFNFSPTTRILVATLIGLYLLAAVVRAFRNFRNRRHDRYSIQPLSARELATARDKLKKG